MIDLTQPLNPRTPHLPGDPEVRVDRIEIASDAHRWQISSICMGSHSGTHMDAPRHLFHDGRDLASFAVSRFIGPGLVIDASGYSPNAAIDVSILDGVRDRVWPGWFAMIRTGWDRHWGEKHYFQHPYLSRELADDLLRLGVGLVGIDALSVDSTADGGSDAHGVFLRSDILIVENLCRLALVDPDVMRMFACLPLALSDADGAPARIVTWDANRP